MRIDVNEVFDAIAGAMADAGPAMKLKAFASMAADVPVIVGVGLIKQPDAIDRLEDLLVAYAPELTAEERTKAAGAVFLADRAGDLASVPLTIAEWAARELAEPDFLSGRWLSTTSRAMFVAPTGLGKTNYLVAFGMHVAAGKAFLHWLGTRPARVLFIDGEMSARLLRRRVAEAARRFKKIYSGSPPETFFALSHEDLGGLQPLNSEAGQKQIEAVIEKRLGGEVDLIIFDNIMSLITGDQKDEEGWAKAMPWILRLTRRHIGQIWVHHTGHNAAQSYGTKTREWQMDTVAHLEEVKRADTDVSFRQEFRKARERTPETRADFQDVTIALVNDEWIGDAVTTNRKKPISPKGDKFLSALANVLASDQATIWAGRKAVRSKDWQEECFLQGLIDREKLPSARTQFGKYRSELVTANQIACHEDFTWLLN